MHYQGEDSSWGNMGGKTGEKTEVYNQQHKSVRLSQHRWAEAAQQERLSVATLVSTGPQSNCQLAKSHRDQDLAHPHEHPGLQVRWE